MNRLKASQQVQVILAIVEVNSINSIVRMTGVAKHTVLKLLEDMGCACTAYHHRGRTGTISKMRRAPALPGPSVIDNTCCYAAF
jgi:hypothetical protein